MKKLSVLILLIVLTISISLKADEVPMPFESTAIGAKVDAGVYGFGPFINYALNRNWHIGAQLGFYYDSGSDLANRKAATFWQLSPFVRAFLLRIQNINIYAGGSFTLLNAPRSGAGWNQSVGSDRDADEQSTIIGLEIGGMWYPFENLGVFSGIKFFEYNIDNSQLRLGLGMPFIGMEYYLK